MEAVSSLTLDPSTFLFFLAIFGYLMSAISFSADKAVSQNIIGLKDWGKSMFCLGSTFLLFFLRGHIPDIYSVFLANLMIFAVPLFGLMAHSRFFNKPIPWKLNAVCTIVGFFGSTLLSLLLTNTRAIMVFFISGSVAILMGTIVVQIYQNIEIKTAAVWFSTISLSLLTIALLSRCVAVLLGNANSVSLFAKTSTQFGFFIAIALTTVGASMGFILMVHERQRQEILESSRRDGLTGLYTRSAFFESAHKIDSVIPPESYSVLMVDIDFFKKINDTYGHAAGDIAIIQLSRLLATHARQTDLVGRYGGEEFCILLRNCTYPDTEKFAQRLVAAAREQRIMLPNNQEISFTISIGYSQRKITVEAKNPTITELLELADQALYQAKHSGRDQARSAITT